MRRDAVIVLSGFRPVPDHPEMHHAPLVHIPDMILSNFDVMSGDLVNEKSAFFLGMRIQQKFMQAVQLMWGQLYMISKNNEHMTTEVMSLEMSREMEKALAFIRKCASWSPFFFEMEFRFRQAQSISLAHHTEEDILEPKKLQEWLLEICAPLNPHKGQDTYLRMGRGQEDSKRNNKMREKVLFRLLLLTQTIKEKVEKSTGSPSYTKALDHDVLRDLGTQGHGGREWQEENFRNFSR